MHEIGVKLGHVLWRKISPKQLLDGDSSLHELTYQLLASQRYGLAIVLLEFAVGVLKKHATEETQLYGVINLCIAYKASGENKKCFDILDETDWTAKRDRLNLAVAVLREQEDIAYALMRKIGTNGEIKSWMYRKWPLFMELRKKQKFIEIFQEIFQEPIDKVEGTAIQTEDKDNFPSADCADQKPIAQESDARAGEAI